MSVGETVPKMRNLKVVNRDAHWTRWPGSVVTIVQTPAQSLKLFTLSVHALMLGVRGMPAEVQTGKHCGPTPLLWHWATVGFGPRSESSSNPQVRFEDGEPQERLL